MSIKKLFNRTTFAKFWMTKICFIHIYLVSLFNETDISFSKTYTKILGVEPERYDLLVKHWEEGNILITNTSLHKL